MMLLFTFDGGKFSKPDAFGIKDCDLPDSMSSAVSREFGPFRYDSVGDVSCFSIYGRKVYMRVGSRWAIGIEDKDKCSE